MAGQRSLSLAALSLGLSLGCVGSIDSGAGIGGPGPNGSGNGTNPRGNTGSTGGGNVGGGDHTAGSGGSVGPGDPTAAGISPLRRLDHREYNNTVRDLLGDLSKPAEKFPADHEDDFGFRRAGLVSSQDYSTVRDAAEQLAAGANIATLAPCTVGNAAAEEACARKFATSFGLRAYRRPLTAAEVENLMTLYKE